MKQLTHPGAEERFLACIPASGEGPDPCTRRRGSTTLFADPKGKTRHGGCVTTYNDAEFLGLPRDELEDRRGRNTATKDNLAVNRCAIVFEPKGHRRLTVQRCRDHANRLTDDRAPGRNKNTHV
jgi:hypothetical protein